MKPGKCVLIAIAISATLAIVMRKTRRRSPETPDTCALYAAGYRAGATRTATLLTREEASMR